MAQSSSFENEQHLTDIINEVLYQTKDDMSFILENSPDKDIFWVRRFNLIFVDTYESFKLFFIKMTPHKYDYSGYYLIVLTINSPNQYQLMKNILEDLWSLQIVNTNIVVEARSGKSDVHFYTFYPYSKTYCEKVIPVVLTTYRSNTFTENIFYPNKIQNLHNCTIKLATFNAPPFVVIKNESNANIIAGVEGNLVKLLAEAMNFYLEVIVPPNDEKVGILKVDGEADGSTGMVLKES